MSTTPDELKEKLEEYDEVDTAVFEPGESEPILRHIPGEKTHHSLAFRLELNNEFVEEVEHEMNQQPDDLSETLTGFVVTLEEDLGASASQLDEGELPILIEVPE